MKGPDITFGGGWNCFTRAATLEAWGVFFRGSLEGRMTEECSMGLGVSGIIVEASELGSTVIAGGEMGIEGDGENRSSLDGSAMRGGDGIEVALALMVESLSGSVWGSTGSVFSVS